jgi:hypothetical protein
MIVDIRTPSASFTALPTTGLIPANTKKCHYRPHRIFNATCSRLGELQSGVTSPNILKFESEVEIECVESFGGLACGPTIHVLDICLLRHRSTALH